MKKMFFAVFLVLFILGCTSASGPAGPGLTIREFSFSPASLTGAQKTALSLVVQNTGSMDVKNAYAKIFGFGEKSKLWNVATACEGCGTGDKNTEAKISLLRAQSSFAGNVGEQKKFVWLLQNNDNIPNDMTRTYTANARLCYPYNTIALGRVELMSENEWMSKNQPQHEIVVSQTSAPVRITVLSKQPIISSGRLSLDLLIENVGGGTVAMPGYCKDVFSGGGDATKTPLNELKLEIPGLTKEKCTTSVGTSNNIFLEKGKSVKVSADCGIGSESAPVSAADLKIEMGYNYYVDAKATVGVKGPNAPLTLPIIIQGTDELSFYGFGTIFGCDISTAFAVGHDDVKYFFKINTEKDDSIKITNTNSGLSTSKGFNEDIPLLKNEKKTAKIKIKKDKDVCSIEKSAG